MYKESPENANLRAFFIYSKVKAFQSLIETYGLLSSD